MPRCWITWSSSRNSDIQLIQRWFYTYKWDKLRSRSSSPYRRPECGLPWTRRHKAFCQLGLGLKEVRMITGPRLLTNITNRQDSLSGMTLVSQPTILIVDDGYWRSYVYTSPQQLRNPFFLTRSSKYILLSFNTPEPSQLNKPISSKYSLVLNGQPKLYLINVCNKLCSIASCSCCSNGKRQQ